MAFVVKLNCHHINSQEGIVYWQNNCELATNNGFYLNPILHFPKQNELTTIDGMNLSLHYPEHCRLTTNSNKL